MLATGLVTVEGMTSAPPPAAASVPAVSESGEDQTDVADHPFLERVARMRAWVALRPRLAVAYRVGVGVVGGALVLVGATLLALPGPGWVTVFLGLAVLGTEFHWARRSAAWLKRRLDLAWAWWKARRTSRAAVSSA